MGSIPRNVVAVVMSTGLSLSLPAVVTASESPYPLSLRMLV